MPESLVELEARRSELLAEISQLGYFRAGSITALVRRCGTPVCRCSRPNDPGHGPNLRLTYKVNGKTYSESFSNQTAILTVQRQIAEFRKYRRLSREFIEVNARICRLRSGDSLPKRRRGAQNK